MYALDGNAYYARPGPRLLQGSGIIARLLHGDAIGDSIGEEISPQDSWTAIVEPQQQDERPATPVSALSTWRISGLKVGAGLASGGPTTIFTKSIKQTFSVICKNLGDVKYPLPQTNWFDWSMRKQREHWRIKLPRFISRVQNLHYSPFRLYYSISPTGASSDALGHILLKNSPRLCPA